MDRGCQAEATSLHQAYKGFMGVKKFGYPTFEQCICMWHIVHYQSDNQARAGHIAATFG